MFLAPLFLALAFGLIVLAGVYSAARMADLDSLVARTVVRETAQSLLSDMQDTETGQRAFRAKVTCTFAHDRAGVACA